MKNQSRENFFLVENEYHPFYSPNGPWKNTLNYMNKFSISETDGFDIAGVFTFKNQLSEVPTFNCLSRAKGIVHVFISEKRRKSYLCLDYISKCLSSIIIQKVKTLRVSVMEMVYNGYGNGFGYMDSDSRIDLYKVEELYRNQRDEYRISLNNQLDSFYDQCLNAKIQIGVVYYFYAQLLDPKKLEYLSGTYVTWGMELKRLFLEVYRVNLLARLSPIDDIFMTSRSVHVIYEKYKTDFSRLIPPPDYTKYKIKTNYPMEDHILFFGSRATMEFNFDCEENIEKLNDELKNKFPKLLF